MKVLIITPIFPPTIGGPATYSNELLTRLPPEIDVKVLTFGQGSNQNVSYVSTVNGQLVRQLKLFLTALKEGISCDIFYLQEPAVVGLSGLLAAKLLGKKIIVKYVGDPGWEKSRFDLKNPGTLGDFLTGKEPKTWLFKITKFVLRNSDRVITPANYLKALLSKAYSLPPAKIKVISNSVDEAQRPGAKLKHSAVVVGRLVNWKNVDLIIKAMHLVHKTLPTAKLTIIGDGPEAVKLKNMGEKNVFFQGSLSPQETLKAIAKSEMLILFSDYEGLPHVAIEAQSRGTLVVASNISGTNEVVNNGQTGILVNPKDISDLAFWLKKLFQDSSLKGELAKQALTNVNNNFLWKKNLSLLTQVFYEVTS